MKKKKVICVGEALIDKSEISQIRIYRFFGGAPANVACALRKLKIDSTFMDVWVMMIMEKIYLQFNELKLI